MLHQKIKETNKTEEAEISYWIGYEYCGKGIIATAATSTSDKSQY